MAGDFLPSHYGLPNTWLDIHCQAKSNNLIQIKEG